MDYEFKTTFWNDFTIAEQFGTAAIEDTYNRAFEEWKNNTEYLTELVIVLNWKIWKFYDIDPNHPYAILYNDLWEKADAYAMDNLKGDDLQYFLETTD